MSDWTSYRTRLQMLTGLVGAAARRGPLHVAGLVLGQVPAARGPAQPGPPRELEDVIYLADRHPMLAGHLRPEMWDAIVGAPAPRFGAWLERLPSAADRRR